MPPPYSAKIVFVSSFLPSRGQATPLISEQNRQQAAILMESSKAFASLPKLVFALFRASTATGRRER